MTSVFIIGCIVLTTFEVSWTSVGIDDIEIVTDWVYDEFEADWSNDIGTEMFLFPDVITIVGAYKTYSLFYIFYVEVVFDYLSLCYY